MQKTTVYCLSKDGQTAVHLDVDALCDAIKYEIDEMNWDDLEGEKYTVEVKKMTEKELDELPEFDGF